MFLHRGSGIASAEAFPLQELEEAFRDRSVMAVPAAAHAGLQIVLTEEQLLVAAGELRSLVRMDHHLGLGIAPPNDCKQDASAPGRL